MARIELLYISVLFVSANPIAIKYIYSIAEQTYIKVIRIIDVNKLVMIFVIMIFFKLINLH